MHPRSRNRHARSERRPWCLFVAGGLAITTACGGQGGSAGKTPTLAAGESLSQACDLGAKEGTVQFRATSEPDVFAKEVKAFEHKYPKIKVRFSSQRPQDSVQRIVTEVQTHHQVDVDAVAIDLPTARPLLQRKLAAPVEWDAVGLPKDHVLTVDGVGLIRTQRIVLGLGYNKNKVSPSQLPSTWDGLVDSKWAGKVVVDPRGEYLSGLGIVWGKDKAVGWYKRFLAVDKPMVVKGATTSLQKVISGEATLTTSSHDAEVREQGADGAPVAIKYLDVVPTQDHYAIVVKGATHPNAALCFLSWYASDAGGVAQQLKYEFKGNESSPKNLPAGAKLGAITDPAQADVQSATAEQFATLTAAG
jgi:iron(III) transport system substrate-binding protein